MATFTNFLNKGSNFLTGAAGSVANRLSQAGLPIGGMFSSKSQSSLQSNVGAPSATGDWAVKITATTPVFNDLMAGAPIFPEAFKKQKGIRFPVTPFINMSHSASYDTRSVMHNNYPYYAYQNSQIDQMTIAGSFPVQTNDDGLNWIASLHFLRTITKMYYGGGKNQGNPPPVCRLNGYGDYVYKDVPIIVTNFTVELREADDYIGVTVPTGGDTEKVQKKGKGPSRGQQRISKRDTYRGGAGPAGMTMTEAKESGAGGVAKENAGSVNYVPTDSLISITVVPVYSRNKISNKFNLKDFASGKLTSGEGFI